MILLGIFSLSMIGFAISSIRQSERDEYQARVRRQRRAFRRELRTMRGVK